MSAVRYAAVLIVFAALPGGRAQAQNQCSPPMPIFPTSITVNPSSVVGSVPITVTATLSDPCNQGGIINFPNLALVLAGPGQTSVTLIFDSGYNPTQTLNEVISASSVPNSNFPQPVTVSAGLTIQPPQLKLSFPQAQVTGGGDFTFDHH